MTINATICHYLPNRQKIVVSLHQKTNTQVLVHKIQPQNTNV